MKSTRWVPFFGLLCFACLLAPRQGVAGLVLHYQFENNLLDASGMGNDGTIVGAGISYAPGIFGQAANFAGVSGDYVRAAHSASLNLSAQMTLAAWIRPDIPTAANGGIIFKGDINNTHGVYDLHVGNFPNPNPDATALINNGTVIASASNVVQFNTWQHLASTYDGAALRLYLDGIQIASTPFVGPIIQEVSPLNIGHRFRSLDGIYKGLIDDVRIYDNALSAAEISGLATATGTTPVPEPSTAVLLALGFVGLGALCCRKDKVLRGLG